ncbi:Uncharacterized protein SCF082_LOCUS3498 [Durusdinium trenchii]|uniref:Uncharacterized protein n=1 Tax=Durusdinium trenchii TaxID=1381693 RepID=A0ABP0HTD0_9DINO
MAAARRPGRPEFAQVRAEEVEAMPTPRARAERPPRSNDALSELPGDLSSKVKAIIGQQMSILEAKLRKEMAVPVAPKDDARTKAQRLEEKLLQQFHRVKEEGQRLRPSKEVLGGEDPMPLAPEESEAAISEEGSVPSMPEAPSLPSTRKLTEELQMQMARVERRLEQLEEDVRRLGRREDHDERPRGAVGPVLGGPVPSTAPEVQATLDRRMDGMQEMLRSLEDGLRSWQSHTQRLEDLWHRGGLPVERCDAAEAAASRLALQRGSEERCSAQWQGGEERPKSVACESPQLRCSGSTISKLTSAPGFSPSSKDLTETSDHQEGELQDLSSEPLSLAVPQLREDDSPPALRLQSLLQGLSFNVEGQTWSNSIAETKAEIERLKSASRRAEHGDVAGPSASASPAANASADEKTS